MEEKRRNNYLLKGVQNFLCEGTSGFLNNRLFNVFLFIMYFSIPFVVHWGHLMAGETLVAGDGIGEVYTMKYLSDSIKAMDFPLWTPYQAGGMPYSDGLTNFYPFLLLCLLLPGVTQIYAYFGVHYAIGGVFMFSYLKKIKCTPFVSLAISTLYLFTAHMGSARKEHIGLIVTALYVPVILYFLERYLQERKIKWLLCGSAAMAMQYIGGFLQYVIYSDIFMFFYLLTGGIHRKFTIKKMLTHGVTWVVAYFGLIMGSVLPMLRMMLLLSKSGGSDMPYDIFTGLSLHPGKLFMTIFPYFFGADVYGGLMNVGNYSSGMDIELFMGCAAVICIFAAIPLFKKNHYVRFLILAIICVLTFACMGQFPFIGNILYKVPAINMFRVCSRTLFLFTFCCMVLTAISLSELSREDSHTKNFKVANIVMGAIFLVSLSIYPLFDVKGLGYDMELKQVFRTPAIAFIVFLAVQYVTPLLKKRGWMTKRGLANMVALTVAVTGIVQLYPFYCHTYYSKYDPYGYYPEELAEKVGTDKVWSSGWSTGVLMSNQVSTRIMTMNAYTNMNLPALACYAYSSETIRMNNSGIYGFYDNELSNILRTKGDFVSMMGVKYIILPEDYTVESILPENKWEVSNVILDSGSNELIDYSSYYAWTSPIELDPDSYYLITVEADAPSDGTYFYVDFMGANYDNTEQEKWFQIKEGKNKYEAFLPSNDSTVTDNIAVRVILPDYSYGKIDIKKVKVEKLAFPEDDYNLYKLYRDYGSYKVFENASAKSLIYAPDKVVPISAEDKTLLYTNTSDYDILNTAYITDGDIGYDFSASRTDVSNIELSNNRVSATVNSSNGGFVNMSQTYYPGWRAYIDGNRGELYEVNGIIMGTFVPSGEHVVEFRYVPTVFYLGAAISVLTVAICVAVSVVSEKRMRKKERDEK